jgi:uncharacterized protein YecT (DUF1311 family)
MTIRRDYIKEIQAKRGRDVRGIFGVLRLSSLQNAFERVKEDAELRRYFPLALVALLEGFVRHSIRTLLDYRAECLAQFLGSSWAKDQRFDLGILSAIAGKQLSVGELVSHLIPIKSFETVDSALSAALGRSFVAQLRTVRKRTPEYQRDNESSVPVLSNEPMISDPDVVVAVIGDGFRLRHVLAHEPASRLDVTKEQIGDQLRAVAAIMNATTEIIDQTVAPEAPMTQLGMNERAGERAHLADLEMMEAKDKAAGNLRGEMAQVLSRSHEAWLDYREAQVEVEGLAYEGGSMRPEIEAVAHESITRARISDFRRLAPRWEREDS